MSCNNTNNNQEHYSLHTKDISLYENNIAHFKLHVYK